MTNWVKLMRDDRAELPYKKKLKNSLKLSQTVISNRINQ